MNKEEREKMMDLLYASFDRKLKKAEQEQLKQALSDPEMEAEAVEIRNMREMLGKTSWDYGDDFAGKVLQRLAKEKVVEMEPVRQYFTVFRRMALAGVAALMILLISIYFTSGTLDKETLFGVESFSEDNLVSYLLYEDFNE